MRPGPAQGRQAPRVVIIGGGFAGLQAARLLGRKGVRVVLVDRRNHHLFQPLLYQVATAVLSPGDIAMPLRTIVGKAPRTLVLLAEAKEVDVEGRRIILSDAELEYDFLIVATGATHSYFGRDDWAERTFGLKTAEDALRIRAHVLKAYEKAERVEDPDEQRALLTFVIIGAGPTGVELAGALAEVSRHALRGEFKRIDPARSSIVLLEGMPRVLPVYPERLSEKARRSLERLGVEVRTSARVSEIDGSGVWIGERHLPARTVLWAAGVSASPLARSLGAPLDKAGRVLVEPTLSVPGHDEVFVVGDLASVASDGQTVPGIAAAAIQEGRHAARNILRLMAGERPEPFRYLDKGYFAVIGRHSAVGVAFARAKLSGFIAWLAWLFVHLMYLVGFRNRLSVLLNWVYSYFTYRRGTRIITGDPPVLPRARPREVVEAHPDGPEPPPPMP